MDKFTKLYKEFEDDFMQPDIILGKYIIDDYGDQHFKDTDCLMDPEKYYARLSAPGFMDCTDYDGPFDSPIEAIGYLVELYKWD